MKVQIETKLVRGHTWYVARIKSGYRVNELVAIGMTDTPLMYVNRTSFVSWLTDTGYEVLNPVAEERE